MLWHAMRTSVAARRESNSWTVGQLLAHNRRERNEDKTKAPRLVLDRMCGSSLEVQTV